MDTSSTTIDLCIIITIVLHRSALHYHHYYYACIAIALYIALHRHPKKVSAALSNIMCQERDAMTTMMSDAMGNTIEQQQHHG